MNRRSGARARGFFTRWPRWAAPPVTSAARSAATKGSGGAGESLSPDSPAPPHVTDPWLSCLAAVVVRLPRPRPGVVERLLAGRNDLAALGQAVFLRRLRVALPLAAVLSGARVRGAMARSRALARVDARAGHVLALLGGGGDAGRAHREKARHRRRNHHSLCSLAAH